MFILKLFLQMKTFSRNLTSANIDKFRASGTYFNICLFKLIFCNPHLIYVSRVRVFADSQ